MAEENSIGIILPDTDKLLVSSSPHLHSGNSVNKIMYLVILALLPACLVGIYYYGMGAIIVLFTCIISSVVFEYITGRMMGHPDSWKDGSALLTGLLLGMILSASVPWWVCIIGSFLAIVIAKQLFGGLGYNPFNPALIARIGLMIGFPKIMTSWVMTLPDAVASGKLDGVSSATSAIMNNGLAAVTTATPLNTLKVARQVGTLTHTQYSNLTDWHHIWEYAIGNMGGTIGEVSAIALLVGGIFLICLRIIKWQTPVTYIGTVVVFSSIVHLFVPEIPGPFFQVVTGGLIIGAFFMATDMVTAPMTKKGAVISGIGCGVITCVIRFWGGYPEGVMFSIVLMNALAPLIDRFTSKKPFGFIDRTKDSVAKA